MCVRARTVLGLWYLLIELALTMPLPPLHTPGHATQALARNTSVTSLWLKECGFGHSGAA